MYCCCRQGLGSVRLHVRVPDPNSKLVEAGVAPIRPTLDPVPATASLGVQWWGSVARPNGQNPKGRTGELPRGVSWPAWGVHAGGGVSPPMTLRAITPELRFSRRGLCASGGQFSIFWINFVKCDLLPCLQCCERACEVLMSFSLSILSEACSGLDSPLRTMGSTGFKG